MSAFVKQANDRKTTRRGVAIEVQVVEEEEFVLLGMEASDLSVDGMLVASEAIPALGTPVVVSFKAPGTEVWIDAEATVARLSRGRRNGDRVKGLGLRFARMSADSRSILARSLIGRPPPVPGRHLRRDYAATIRSLGRS